MTDFYCEPMPKDARPLRDAFVSMAFFSAGVGVGLLAVLVAVGIGERIGVSYIDPAPVAIWLEG